MLGLLETARLLRQFRSASCKWYCTGKVWDIKLLLSERLGIDPGAELKTETRVEELNLKLELQDFWPDSKHRQHRLHPNLEIE